MNIRDILSKLTINEKISLLSGKTAWSLNDIKRLDIPEIIVTDGPHGVRWSPGSEFSNIMPATSLPIEAAMASTFNDNLIKRAGKMAAIECHHYGIGVLLGPGVNGKRSPLAGRNFEYYSEDPLLSGKMAAAFIKGVQGEGVGTSLKHFAVNDQETRRMTINVELDERALNEIYLLPFEIAIKEANPWTIMAAYNKVKGEHACQNKTLLLDILRDNYKYDGLVMSDWGGVKDKTLSHINGLDLEMPGPNRRGEELLEAYSDGRLTDAILDQRVYNVLNLINKVEVGKRDVDVDWQAHHKLAQDVASESIVLLKNEENILPLKSGGSIAVLGEFADKVRFQGGGSSFMNPKQLDLHLSELEKYAQVTYAVGYNQENTSGELIDEAKAAAKDKDQVVIFIGTTEKLESEGYDRRDMKLPSGHIELIKAVSQVNENIIVVINSGAAVETRHIEMTSHAIIQAWLPGEGGAHALAKILFGEISPSGKLSETFPICLEHNPTYGHFPGFKDFTRYSESIYVGYRYYDTKKLEPQYAFGHGLSYTSFEYSNMKLSTKTMDVNQKLEVSVDITNTGKVDGKETVQLYVHDCESYLNRPEKELKAYTKVSLSAGETKTVVMTLEERAFAYYVPHLGKFAVESGEFDILIAASSKDIRLKDTVYVRSEETVKMTLNEEDTVLEWLDDSETCDIIEKLLNIIQIGEDHLMYPIIVGLPVRQVFMMMQMFGAPVAVIEPLKMAVLGDRSMAMTILTQVEQKMMQK